MSHSPPVPEGNQSPYPRHEPPHAAAEPADEADRQLPVVVDADDDASLLDRLRALPLGRIGAAVGIGGALIGGLLLGLRRDTPIRGGKRRA